MDQRSCGAEITRKRLTGALAGAPPLELEDAEKIWARWNAMPPEQQAAEMLKADRACGEDLERLDEATRRELRVPRPGGEFYDLATQLSLELNEHALHAWDAAVTFDTDARLAPGSVPLLGGRRLLVRTSDPEHWLAIDLAGEPRILQVDPDRRPDLVIPAEALLRLCYGRLDSNHTPAGIHLEPPLDLDDLRATFNGY